MAKVLFHPEADAEYAAALGWYQARSLRAAARFETEVERILGLIVQSPEAFPKYDDEHRFAALRRYPYAIVYRPEQAQIWVIAIAHSSRSPGYWRGRS